MIKPRRWPLMMMMVVIGASCGTDDAPADMGAMEAPDLREQPDQPASPDLGAPDMSTPPDMAPDAAPDMMPVDMDLDMSVDMDLDMSVDMLTDMSIDMSVDMSEDMPGAMGETCARAIPVLPPLTLRNQTTVGAGDDSEVTASQPGCPQGRASGPDRFYEVRVLNAGSVVIRVTPQGGFDPLLYVLDACDATACVAGTALNGPGDPEEVRIDGAQGQTLYVVVDGELGSQGDYSLDVVMLP